MPEDNGPILPIDPLDPYSLNEVSQTFAGDIPLLLFHSSLFQFFIFLKNLSPIRSPVLHSSLFTVKYSIMPIVFSSPGALAVSEKVLWVDEYVFRADAGLLTPNSQSFGFKTYIPSSAKELLSLDPIEYLAAFRDQMTGVASSKSLQFPPVLQGPAKKEAVGKGVDLADPVAMQRPTIPITRSDADATFDGTTPMTRKSATLHKNLISKLRPLPFQYVWTVYYEKAAPSTSSSTTTKACPATYTDRLTTLASVPTIGEFYKVFNNLPWSAIRARDSVHIFRSGVEPVWEDPENVDGGCWTLKVRRQHQADDRPRRVWEEICLMACGGELQAALAESGSRDHVLGLTFTPRLYWVQVRVWVKKGGDETSRAVVQTTVLERLSPELRPASDAEYYYKKHSEHDGWEDAVGVNKGRD